MYCVLLNEAMMNYQDWLESVPQDFKAKDRARFYEYSLGSARESRDWYHKARHVLGDEVVQHRQQLLTEIIRLLLSITPQERSRNIGEEQAEYSLEINLDHLLQNVPLP